MCAQAHHINLLVMPTKNYLLYHAPGAKNGLLIRGGDVLERLSGVDVVVLDKVISCNMLHFLKLFLYLLFPFDHIQNFRLSIM